MRCSNCGNTSLFAKRIEKSTGESWLENDDVIPYVCSECGHIEFFAKDEVLKKRAKLLEEAKKRQLEEAKIEEEITFIQSRIDSLIPVTEDKTKTIQEVKAALQEISKLNVGFSKLNVKLKKLITADEPSDDED